ncbi:MAG: EAL domain-containing protein [Lachnospiraceae bacterium]|nr:EAL domain-containing protein [Lachnospiraceae bacterium]
MSDEFRDDKIDRDLVAKYFPEIFSSFSNTSDGKYVFLSNMANDYSYWSPEAVDYFGLPDMRMYHSGIIWNELIDPNDFEAYQASIMDLFTGKTDTHDFTYRARNKFGKYVTVSCKGRIIKDKEGKPLFFAGTIVNHEKNDTIDPVTGLPGRTHMFKHMGYRRNNNIPYYFMISGIKNFFEVNTAYGYIFGNRVLKELAEYIRSINPGAGIFRTDGTKIVVAVDNKGIAEEELRERYASFRRYCENELIVDGVHISVEVCSALMKVEDVDLSVNTIYNSILYALDKAKEDNSPELVIIDNDTFDDNEKRLRLINEIRNCIGENFKGFFLCYQPIMDAHTEKPVGMEALLRWRNKDNRIIPPNDFIPWLERDPIFFDLGNWILRQAINDLKKIIKRDPSFVVNINLAYPQLQRDDFKASVDAIIREEGISADNIKMELTERCKLLDQDMLRNHMIFLKTLGMQTALDDFGTGYSALNLLADLPVDQIKIDKSFVDDIETNPSKQSLMRAITSCAKELDKNVCVEGIETQKMAEYLRDHYYVTSFQGYYYSKPVEIDDFLKWMEEYGK